MMRCYILLKKRANLLLLALTLYNNFLGSVNVSFYFKTSWGVVTLTKKEKLN